MNELSHGNANITTRRKKNNMAARTTTEVMMNEEMMANTSLIIDEILSQKEKEDVTKMLEEEEDVDKWAPTKGWVREVPKCHHTISKLLEDTTLDDLNEVMGRIGERFNENEVWMEEYRQSLEFSQKEIEDLKSENKELKLKIKLLEREDSRNDYQINDLEEKFGKLETQTRKRNLVLEGIEEPRAGEKEDLQHRIYSIFDQMGIDHAVECDICYRTGPYNKSRPRPVIVSFLKQADRDHVFAKRVNLKTSRDYGRIWINEDLAPAARRTKTVVRLVTKQAQNKGIPCKNGKFSVTVGDIKYNENTLTELPNQLSVKNVKQVQIDPRTVAYQSEFAPFSSLYPAKVKIGEHDYDTSEQAFQHIKAKSNNRPLLAERILLSKKTYEIKQMGGEVKTTDVWNDKEEDVMYSIQLRKFQQNPRLAEALIATQNLELVEATPSKKWGAGATLSSNVLKRHEWPGENKHGKILMTIRAKLIRDAKEKDTEIKKKREEKGKDE